LVDIKIKISLLLRWLLTSFKKGIEALDLLYTMVRAAKLYGRFAIH
jgi:hypothetical protein